MRDGVRALEDCWMFDEDESYDDGEEGWDAKKGFVHGYWLDWKIRNCATDNAGAGDTRRIKPAIPVLYFYLRRGCLFLSRVT